MNDIVQLTIELTRLRMEQVPHLAIENFAPELYGNLLREQGRDVGQEQPQVVADVFNALSVSAQHWPSSQSDGIEGDTQQVVDSDER